MAAENDDAGERGAERRAWGRVSRLFPCFWDMDRYIDRYITFLTKWLSRTGEHYSVKRAPQTPTRWNRNGVKAREGCDWAILPGRCLNSSLQSSETK